MGRISTLNAAQPMGMNRRRGYVYLALWPYFLAKLPEISILLSQLHVKILSVTETWLEPSLVDTINLPGLTFISPRIRTEEEACAYLYGMILFINRRICIRQTHRIPCVSAYL